MKTHVNPANPKFAPGTSRTPQRPHSFALQMAMEIERRQDMAARIRTLRGPKPQPVIANAVGVGLRTYQTWEEAAVSPSWENLQALAQHFKVSEDYLLYGDAEPQGPETQLDRIEQQLGRVLDLLAELEIRSAQQPKRKPGSGRAKAAGE